MIKPKPKIWNWPGIGVLLLVSVLAVSFLNSPGTSDVLSWEVWSREISAYGLVGGFAHINTDYPPLSFVILKIVSGTSDPSSTIWFISLKVSLLCFLFASAACFYWFTRNLLLTAALESTLLLNSVGLAYLDIWFAPFLLAGLFCLARGRLNFGVFFFALSCSIKWQPLIIAPFVCLYVWNKNGQSSPETGRFWKRLVPFAIPIVFIALPLFAIFGGAIINSFRRALTVHTYLSAYALNFGWLHTWALHLILPQKYGALDNGAIYLIDIEGKFISWPEKVLFFASYFLIVVAFARQTKTFARLIVYSMLGYFAYFSFNSGVHENHLFLVSALAWILVFNDPNQLLRGINLSIAANANLFLCYGFFGRRLNPVIGGVDITLFFALSNLCLFAGFLAHAFKTDQVKLKFWQANKFEPTNTVQ